MKRIQYNLFKRKKDEKHYVWYYSYTDPFTGIRKQKRCKDCETLKEARIYVDSLPKYEISNILFRDFAEDFYSEKGFYYKRKKEKGYALKKSTIYRKQGCMKNQILPKWGKILIKDITLLQVERWLSRLDLSNGSKNHLLFIMREIFEEAVFLGILASNPLVGFSLYKEKPKEKEILTIEEINVCFPLSLEKLKHLYQSEDLGLCFLLMVSTGIRLGEAIALTWEAVDFERGGILIFQQWGKLDGISAPKKNEYRSIVVPEKILALLKEFRNKKNPKADDFCFESPLGNHLSLSQFSILSKITEKLIQKKITPHCLRHTYNTQMRHILLSNGVSEEVLRSFMGHKSVSMTNLYDHPELTKKLEALSSYKENVDQFFSL